MDELVNAFLNLGIGGASLLVFWLVIKQMLDNHKTERLSAQSSYESTIKQVVSDFREEQDIARTNCREEAKNLADTFERNLEKIRAGWGK